MASQEVKGQQWGFLEIRRIVKVCFESDIPGLTLQHHYQEIDHPSILQKDLLKSIRVESKAC